MYVQYLPRNVSTTEWFDFCRNSSTSISTDNSYNEDQDATISTVPSLIEFLLCNQLSDTSFMKTTGKNQLAAKCHGFNITFDNINKHV